jgi:hypothetical protein
MHAALLTTTLAAAVVLATAGTAPAEAQWRDRSGSNAHADGYNAGAQAGNDDARDGRPFEYQRHRAYRDGDRGYNSRYGGRDDYKQQYRAGFVAGYRDSYYASGGRSGGYGRPSYGGGPASGGVYGRGRGGWTDIAYSRGFDEGYRKGVEDGRDRDRRDPRRHGWYRDGDRGYRSEYGPRALYQRSYRSAFEQGYDLGYDDGRRQRSRGIW